MSSHKGCIPSEVMVDESSNSNFQKRRWMRKNLFKLFGLLTEFPLLIDSWYQNSNHEYGASKLSSCYHDNYN